MKEIVRTDGAPAPAGPYSQGAIGGRLLFVAGQIPRDPRTVEVPQEFKAQVEQCLRNVQAIVEASGARMSDVVKVNAYLKDLSTFKSFNEVYEKVFQAPYPARTTVGVDLAGVAVEIDAIVSLPR